MHNDAKSHSFFIHKVSAEDTRYKKPLISPTWFRNVSFHLHPLVGGHSLLRLAGVVSVGAVQVVRAAQLGEVVRVEAVAAGWVGHALQVRVERAWLRYRTVVVTHLAWTQTASVSNTLCCNQFNVLRNIFKVVPEV